jgi:hypothetical protein
MTAALSAALPSTAKLVKFDNTKPRLDSAGAILRAHDGTTQRFGKTGPYYYHAMGYPHCNESGAINGCNKCIYGHNNSMTVYSSPDLVSVCSILPTTSLGFQCVFLWKFT